MFEHKGVSTDTRGIRTPLAGDQWLTFVIWPPSMCLEHRCKGRAWAVSWSLPGRKLDPLVEEEFEETGQAQVSCSVVLVPLFQKGDQGMCCNHRCITLVSLPGKVYSTMLGRRNTRPALHSPPCSRGFTGVHSTSPHMLCGFGKGIQMCVLMTPVVGAPGVWGPGPLVRGRPVPDDRGISVVHIAGSKSELFQVHVGLR